ncbi:MAG: flagellar biosynthesis protein [Burkholderiales bacterium]
MPAQRVPLSDQADGLRRLFASHTVRFVPVISNPFIAFGGVLIERLCSVLDELGMDTLLIDASERGGPPKELTGFDLAEGIEQLSTRVAYMAARGLPVRWVDSRGSTRSFLDAVAEASPTSQVVLVHGSAIEMARLFGRGGDGLSRPCPLLLCDDRPEAMTHAYAALKILAQRADWLAHDLLLCAPPESKQARVVADRLAHCADLFLGGVQRNCASVDPAELPTDRPADALIALVKGLLDDAAVYTVPAQGRAPARAALPTAHASAPF